MPRIPLIKFPKRNLKAPSAPVPSQPADQHATLMSRLGAKAEAPSSGGIKNYRFSSDVPSPPSHTAVGGQASLLPKRKPLTEEEIEAIMIQSVLRSGQTMGVFGMALLHPRAALLQNSGWSSSAPEFRLFLITGGSGG
ncbi:uncharacterized protein [Zea mays]|uniref:uncharacterized protein isoform X1 n=1 Tax=Zea mays TaxID=4577 RepID=UPI001652F8F0|nr:uncharacterized protein LOC100275762 isoform X1 [Zea mays]